MLVCFSLAKPNKVYDAANDQVQGISKESGDKCSPWSSHRTVTPGTLRKTQKDLEQVLAAVMGATLCVGQAELTRDL